MPKPLSPPLPPRKVEYTGEFCVAGGTGAGACVSIRATNAGPEAFPVVLNAPVVVGKFNELVFPVTYATLLGPRAMASPKSIPAPPR